jgi:hypothetical protein
MTSYSVPKTLSALTILALTGCASTPALQSFRADTNVRYDLREVTATKIYLKEVTKAQDDATIITCPVAGSMAVTEDLPLKMSYSAYIRDAFDKTLFALGKQATLNDSEHSLSIALTRVEYDSRGGKWTIEGDVSVDYYPPIHVDSFATFEQSVIPFKACKNTVDAFESAVAVFIKRSLTHPMVLKFVNRPL